MLSSLFYGNNMVDGGPFTRRRSNISAGFGPKRHWL